uniref:Uncharacterized protein n=1 Tax=Oryza glaberrima TaxID=4538 RepID=I1QZW2_ORYGL
VIMNVALQLLLRCYFSVPISQKVDFCREMSHGPLFYLGSRIQGLLYRLPSRTAVPWRQHPP